MIIKRNVPLHTCSIYSSFAQILDRLGLAMIGAASGLFVATVSGVDLMDSSEVMLAMMLYGAVGFYLGINLPQPHYMNLQPPHGLGVAPERLQLLTAFGTFFLAVATVVSIFNIVLGQTVDAHTAEIIFWGWVISATVQIAGGAIVRTKLAGAVARAKRSLFFQ
jgi:hypothetical protein